MAGTGAVSESSGSGGKSGKSLLEANIPPTLPVLSQVRTLVAEPTLRINVLSSLVFQDPPIAMELLKVANSMQYAAGRPPATTLKATFERLGADTTIEVLDKLIDSPQLNESEGLKFLESAKKRCQKTGLASRIVGEAVAKTLVEEAEIAGLLFHIGDLLAVVNFKAEYVKLAKDLPRVKLLYRMEKDLKFDVHKMGLLYLRRFGIPEGILFGIDPDAQLKTPGKGPMKMICAAASEMVLAAEADRWEKLAPGNPIPPKSPIRLLGLNDNQYAALYERLGPVVTGTGADAKAAG